MDACYAGGAWQPAAAAEPLQPAAFVPLASAGAGLDLSAGFLLPACWPAVASDAQQAQHKAQQQQQQLDGLEPAEGVGKGRLRWSAALHAKFTEAVKQLGGALQATPKRILAVMDVPGLTLFHIKSHLQKYRSALDEGKAGARRRRGGAAVCKRRAAAAKRSAASMRATDSGSDSDEWEEAEDGAGHAGQARQQEGAEGPSLCLGLGGLPPQLGRRHSSKLQRQEGGQEGSPRLLPCLGAAAGGQPAEPCSPNSPLAAACGSGSLGLGGWGSEADLAAVDAELAAALGQVDATLEAASARLPGDLSDDDDIGLLCLPEGLRELHRQLSQQGGASGSAGGAQEGAAPPLCAPADAARAAPASVAAPPMSPPLPEPRSPVAPAPPPPAPASSSDADGGCSSGGGCRQEDLLEHALRLQVQMQRQLSSAMEAQRALQQQLEKHGEYIEALLRSEGALPAKPAAPAAAARPNKPRAPGGSQASKRGGGGGSRGHSRSNSLLSSPAAPVACREPSQSGGGMRRTGSAPQLAAAAPAAGCMGVPPLHLPVPGGLPAAPMHGWQHMAMHQPPPPLPPVPPFLAPSGSPVPAGLHMQQQALQPQPPAPAEQPGLSLSPADVELLMAAPISAEFPPAAQQLPLKQEEQQQQQQQNATLPGTSVASADSGGGGGASRGASGESPAPQPQQRQCQPQAQQLVPPMDAAMFSSDMWDSLMEDTGVLDQLLSDL